MSRSDVKNKNDNSAFICGKCGRGVIPAESGTMNRNHCPECLWSRHVDVRTGDRGSVCRGMMEPIGIWVKGNEECSLIHRCEKCGFIRANRVAGDDNYLRLMGLAVKPVMMFPLNYNALSAEAEHLMPGGVK